MRNLFYYFSITAMNPTYDHADMKSKVGVSNLKMFDGEDLGMRMMYL